MNLPSRVITADFSSETRTVRVKDLYIDFIVAKSLSSSAVDGVLKIKNLSEDISNFVKSEAVEVVLRAGYSDVVGVIYAGDIRRSKTAKSSDGSSGPFERNGEDVITEVSIGGRVGKFSTVYFQRSYDGVVEASLVLNDIATALNMNTVNASSIPRVSLEDFSFNGRAVDALDEVTTRIGNQWFEDNGLIVFGLDGESHEVVPVDVSEATGLINVPELDRKGVKFKVRMSPAFSLGGLVNLKSAYNVKVNGLWKIKKMKYKGSNNTNEHTVEIEGVPIS